MKTQMRFANRCRLLFVTVALCLYTNKLMSQAVIPAVHIVFGSEDGFIYCLEDSSEGQRILWSYKTSGKVLSNPIVVGDKVFIGNSNGDFYGLDAKTGKALWKNEKITLDNPIVIRANAVSNDGQSLLIHDTSHILYRINMTTGSWAPLLNLAEMQLAPEGHRIEDIQELTNDKIMIIASLVNNQENFAEFFKVAIFDFKNKNAQAWQVGSGGNFDFQLTNDLRTLYLHSTPAKQFSRNAALISINLATESMPYSTVSTLDRNHTPEIKDHFDVIYPLFLMKSKDEDFLIYNCHIYLICVQNRKSEEIVKEINPEFSAVIRVNVAINEDILYLSSEKSIGALNYLSGEEIWRVPNLKMSLEKPILAVYDEGLMVAFDQLLAMLDAKSGKILWKIDQNNPILNKFNLSLNFANRPIKQRSDKKPLNICNTYYFSAASQWPLNLKTNIACITAGRDRVLPNGDKSSI